MSKCVLLSVRPQYCELIANGKKTIEVRKTRPKLETPFKCYIYCTAPKKFYKISEYMATSAEYLHLCDGKVTMSDGFEFLGREDYKVLNRKVIGEFVCDEITTDLRGENTDILCNSGCLTLDELKKYGGNNPLYGWHISALQIYDKPRELNEFHKPTMPTGLRYEDDAIKRPPESWCYVEEYDGKR